MSVFSGVVAILSPNFVTRFLKESGRDVLSKLQTEYGVNCMRTSEDICTVQGEWEAMLKVHSFLKEAENSTAVAPKGRAGGPMTCNALGGGEQRNGAGGLTSSLANDADHATSDFQVVSSWGSENGGLGAAGLSHDEPSAFSLSNGPDAQASLGTVIHIVPTAGSNSSSRSLLANMPKLTYKGQNAPPPPPPLQRINRDNPSFPDHETDIKPSILVNENFMTNLKLTPPKKKKSPKAIAKKSTAKKAGTAAKELKKRLCEENSPIVLSVALSPPPSHNQESEPLPAIKTEPLDDSDVQCNSLSNSVANDTLDDMPVLTKQVDNSPSLSVTPTKSEGGLDCLKCKKVFSEHKELEVHMYVYHNPDCMGKEIQCPYCSKIFLSKNGLEEHMYNHVGTRPFSCHLCPVSFNHRKSLRRHLERHSNTRKFSCDQCSLTFMRKEALDTHRLIHQKDSSNGSNPNARIVGCTVCDEKFDSMASYRKHMQYDHYEINETLNLGPTTHLEELEGFEDDEDVVDLFKDEGDDGDWRKPKKKTKARPPARGVKRKAPSKPSASKKKLNENDNTPSDTDADASFDASSFADNDNDREDAESNLDDQDNSMSTSQIISKQGGDPVFGHEEEPIIDQEVLAKDKSSNHREDRSEAKTSKRDGASEKSGQNKAPPSPKRDTNAASPATPASEHSSDSNDSSEDESSSSSSKSDDSD